MYDEYIKDPSRKKAEAEEKQNDKQVLDLFFEASRNSTQSCFHLEFPDYQRNACIPMAMVVRVVKHDQGPAET